MHAHAMNNRHRDAHVLLAALGHASRFRIALRLLDGERCVGDLAVSVGLSQSCTTRHVQALERAGLVRSRRDGKRVLVALDAARAEVAALLEWIAPGSAAARPAPAGAAGPFASRSRPPGPARSVVARRRPAAAPPPARAADPQAPHAPGAETPPAEPPASGTHAAPEQPPAPRPPRLREALEDFLL